MRWASSTAARSFNDPASVSPLDSSTLRTRSNLASVNATLASAIESTIESRVSRLLHGDFFEKTSGA